MRSSVVPGVAAPRTRVTASVFVAVAGGFTAYFAALTVAPLAGREVSGSTAWSGLPFAATIVGTALGAGVVSRRMASHGRRSGLVLGFLIAAGGAVGSLAAVAVSSPVLLLFGMVLIGTGNGCCLQARYAVAEVHAGERSSAVLGLVLWAGTIGALAGPNLVQPAGAWVSALGAPAFAGGLAVAGAAFLAAAAVCRSLPPAAAAPPADVGGAAATTGGPAHGIPPARIQVAFAAMLASQVVMVLIMTMTPLHVVDAGHELAVTGAVMSVHMFGMYAFTPAVGWAADRWGARAVIAAGLLTLGVAAVTAATADPADVPAVATALFLLGLGWSAGFVAASGMLAAGGRSAALARLQGTADVWVFGSAAVASAAAGPLVALTGFTATCLTAAAVLLVPATVVWRRRRTLVGVLPPA